MVFEAAPEDLAAVEGRGLVDGRSQLRVDDQELGRSLGQNLLDLVEVVSSEE